MKHTKNQQLEEHSKSVLRLLVTSVGWIYREKNPDRGIDIEIEIVESEKVTNKVFWVQVKSTESIDAKKEISYPMETKHLKYYSGCQIPVIILYWIKSKNEFYYIFAQRYIQEIITPQKPEWRKQKTVTIKFSPESKLDNIERLNTRVTQGYLYIMQQKVPENVQSWLDGIPESNNETLKERTVKAILYLNNEKHNEAIAEFEDILKVCTVFSTERMSILLKIGNSYYSISDYENALKYYRSILDIAEKVHKKDALQGKSAALGNIGLIYRSKGDLKKALKYYQDALKIDREIGYKQGEASDLSNIGLIYSDKGDLEKALKYHQDALKIDREIGHKLGEANQLGNIGLIYYSKGDLDNALKYLKDALKIHREIGYKEGEASDLGNIGLIYINKGDFVKAMKYLKDALDLLDKYNLIYGRVTFQNAIETIEKIKKD